MESASPDITHLQKRCRSRPPLQQRSADRQPFPRSSLRFSSLQRLPAPSAQSSQPPWLSSGLLGCSFGFPVGSCFDLGHLHICQGVRGKARAHAFNGPLVSCPLLLQRADHVLHFALPRKEVLHIRLQRLNLLPGCLKDTHILDLGKYRVKCRDWCLDKGWTNTQTLLIVITQQGVSAVWVRCQGHGVQPL